VDRLPAGSLTRELGGERRIRVGEAGVDVTTEPFEVQRCHSIPFRFYSVDSSFHKAELKRFYSPAIAALAAAA
jgi:hypothetical protein